MGKAGSRIHSIFFLALFVSLAFLNFPHQASAQLFKAPSKLGLMGYWPFNEMTNAGALTGDFSGNNLSATVSGPDLFDGKLGNAFRFSSASAEYVVRALDGTALTETTVSFWVKPTATPGSQSGMFQWANVVNSGTPFILVAYDSSNNVKFYVDVGYRLTTTLPLNQWSHITVTLNTSNLWTFYINGVSAGTYQDDATHPDQANAASVYFASGYNAYFDGLIDETRVYNRALTSTEVWKLYKSGGVTYRQPNNLGLVGYWSLNEGKGTIAGDFSGSGNNGTLVNSPTWDDGKFGSSLHIAGGSTQGVSIPSTTDFDSTVGTWSAWVKPSSYSYTNPPVIMARHDTANSHNGFTLFMSTLQPGIEFYNGSTSVCLAMGSITIPLDKWSFVTVVYSQANGATSYVYVNGVQSSSCTNSASWAFNNQVLKIGDAEYTWWDSFNGDIDEARVYGRALLADEVWNLYKTNSKYTLVNTSPTKKLVNGLVGYWTFDGNQTDWSAPNTWDSTPNSNDGTMTNMDRRTSVGSGKYGQALNFDGVDDYVNVANPTSFNLGTADYTISAWVKRSFVDDKSTIMTKCDIAGGWETKCKEFYIGDAGDGNKLVFGSFDTTQLGSNTSFDTAWHYVVMSFTDSSNLVQLYVDGVFDNSNTQALLADDAAHSLVIGGATSVFDPAAYFKGKIDDVRFYNRVLSATEILSLYRTGK